ncbi:hypothetical protein ACOI1C_13575 [Bacillus sp. DJP31]|uniref:hypothetical protein n=1 Tax=Bacillus sp. DJP31 TaxID=3409789 RepID=UPI003BB64F2F
MLSKEKVVLLTLSLLLGLLVSVGFSVTTEGSINANVVNLFEKYQNKEENDLIKDIKKLNKTEIIAEINLLSDGNSDILISSSILIPFASALVEKKSEISNEEIINQITEENNTIITKHILVDLFFQKNSNNKEVRREIKRLLVDNRIDKAIKVKILMDSDVESSDEPILLNNISNNDDEIAFVSMKKLSQVNLEKAYEISKEIIKNKDTESKHKISAALKATSKFLNENKDNHDYDELEASFIEESKSVMAKTEDKFLSDSAFFSISDLMSENAILSIIVPRVCSLSRWSVF